MKKNTTTKLTEQRVREIAREEIVKWQTQRLATQLELMKKGGSI